VRHPDAEILALLALGEPVDDEAAAHVRSCQECRDELQDLERVVTIGRDLDEVERDPPRPPEHVWASIAAAVEEGRDDAGTSSGGLRVVEDRADDGVRADPGAGGPVEDVDEDGTAPGRGRRFFAALAAAALLGAVAGAGVVSLWDPTPPAEVVATTQLEPIRGDGDGDARLERVTDGLVLEVAAQTLPGTPGYYEVWLIDPETFEMISLGPLRADGRYAVPEGLDTGRYSLVDISAEPHDGETAHSGDSLLRGELGDESSA
jgi:hypothetical protein